jgi:nuclear pore complex protein Nup107
LEAPESQENVLHPLREAANRVGREVEKFAEALDGYNPLKALDDAGRYEMTFDLIDMYHDIALETVNRLRDQHAAERRKHCGVGWREKMRGFRSSQDPEVMDTDDIDDPSVTSTYLSTTIEDLKRWEEEAQTWDLLRRMIKLTYPFSDSKDLINEPLKPIHRYSSERQVWTAFLESDALALERNTVLRWLRDTADESGEDIDVLAHDLQQNAERGDIIAHGWLHTKAAIKNQKRIHVWPQVLDPSSPDIQKMHLNSSKTEPLVTQLDPDAPVRQSRSLEMQDQYFERAIWLGCYEMLRRGRSTRDIREWCRDRTEIWRAVSMSALPDADIEDSDTTSDHVSSALWRRMCFALAKRGDIDEYERAVYGILSGDISAVEPVCHSWDDHIFVHYNALVRSQFENYLSIHYPNRVPKDVLQGFGVFDALQFHGDPETAGERLVSSLNFVPQLKTEIVRPMKMLQGVLIAKKFENFIYHQGLWLSKLANADRESNLIPKLNMDPENEDTTTYIDIKDHDSLRVLVHIFLVLKTFNINLEQPVKRLATENVVVAYIDFLRLAGKEELIPLYSSQLTGNRVYATLSRELVDVTDPVQRETQIRLIRDLGLDVQQFVRYQTRFLFQDFPDDSVGYPADEKFNLLEDSLPPDEMGRRVRHHFIGNDIDRIDMLLIRSLEWHLLVDGLWSETFYTGTLLYKRFFSESKYRMFTRMLTCL